jgi:hypothetical protein
MIRRPISSARAPQGRSGPALFWILQLAFIGVSVVLALWIPKHGSAVTWHGRLTLLGGVALAMIFSRPAPAAYAAAYITGCEVFWRMKRADLPWEMGKYAVIAVLGMAIVRSGKLKRGFLPIAYFMLLLPSCVLILGQVKGEDMREQLTFNLMGPLAIAVCAAYFASVPLTVQELRNTLICLIGPIVGTAVLGIQSLEAKGSVNFADASNAAASGGYGPNQVAAILGLGIVAVLMYLAIGSPSKLMTGALIVILLVLVRQCILTFSRGGLYMALGAAAAGAFFLIQDKRQRTKVFLGGGLLALVFIGLILPRIEALTRGAVSERFSSVDTTGRMLLIEADIETFFRYPVMGIGPGLGGKNRLRYFHVAQAHTEWTRMLAEHGVLGIASMAFFFAMCWSNLKRAQSPREKAIVAAGMTYCVLHLCVDATRLVAPSFAFGLGSLTLLRPRKRAATPAHPPAPPSPVIPRVAGAVRPRVAGAAR